MATAVEQAFIAAVTKANGVRQAAYATAFATYAPSGFGVFANLTAYQTAIQAADAAWLVSVNSAASTAAIISPNVADRVQGQFGGLTASILT